MRSGSVDSHDALAGQIGVVDCSVIERQNYAVEGTNFAVEGSG